MTPPVISAVARTAPGQRQGHARTDWQKVEIVGEHPSGRLILREIGPFWPGIWLADRGDVRLTGPEFEPAPSQGRPR